MNIPKIKRKLDRLFSQYILNRDKRICCRCGKTNCKIDTSHIIPREILITRWAPSNAVALCFKCHKLIWHKSPVVGVRWLDTYLGTNAVNTLVTQSWQPFELTEQAVIEIENKLKIN